MRSFSKIKEFSLVTEKNFISNINFRNSERVVTMEWCGQGIE